MSVHVDSAGSARYTIAHADSWLTFEARSTLHAVHGKTADLVGYIETGWSPDGALGLQPAPKMHVDFAVEQLRSGNDLQDREMWKLIDSKRFPRIAADLRDVRAAPTAGRYTAAGDITLAGRARRYEGELALVLDGDSVTVDGELNVDIREFGIKPPNLLIMKVEPIVNVRLHLVARAA